MTVSPLPEPVEGPQPVGGWVAAVDLGATSGRVILGHVGPDLLTIEAVHRFVNAPVRLADGLHWNILELYQQVLVGLRIAVQQRPELVSIGIDSWAVDYGLVDGERLAGVPFHYRDERTAAGVEAVHATVSQDDLYAAGGLQFLPFNTLYQLAVDAAGGTITAGTTMLMIPDLLGFWLTGTKASERTNATTTGLLDLVDGTWNRKLLARLALPGTLFPAIVDPGTTVGALRPSVRDEIGSDRDIDLVAVGSHDTASAVVAVPMGGRDAAYISSGTWSLVGMELDEPVLTDPSFTNEGGVDGRVRYLRNVMGLWLLTESIRAWVRAGEAVELADLLARAAAHTGEVAVFDANDPSLLPPGDMPARIVALCDRDRLPVPTSPVEFVRSICESLAAAYATALDDAERLSRTPVSTVHIVGGGSQNALLCQLTADRSGRRVLAGPVEATAIGNVLVQARAAGLVAGSLEDLRALVAKTFPPTQYLPNHHERKTAP